MEIQVRFNLRTILLFFAAARRALEEDEFGLSQNNGLKILEYLFNKATPSYTILSNIIGYLDEGSAPFIKVCKKLVGESWDALTASRDEEEAERFDWSSLSLESHDSRIDEGESVSLSGEIPDDDACERG